eukprot:5508619-Ditylum_brightwellii.AAC.1
MNALVAKHAPKKKIYCTSTSLKNRMNVAVGVQEWNFFPSMDNTHNKYRPYKKQHDTKLKCKKEAIQKMKDKCAKVKKDQEEGHVYGDKKDCALSSNMVSMCTCPGKKITKAQSQRSVYGTKILEIPFNAGRCRK